MQVAVIFTRKKESKPLCHAEESTRRQHPASLILNWNPHNTLQQTSSQQQGSLLQTTGDLTINVGQDLIANAATISSSQGNLTASAGNSITIGTGLSITTSQGHTSYGYGTTNSTAAVTTHSTSSLAAGNNLTLQSGADSHLTSVIKRILKSQH